MSDSYDVIIIGSGHNGLVTAAYLAKAGLRIAVLEKKEIIGGKAVTEDLFPGFKVSSLVDGTDSFSPQIISDLNLAEFGLDILPTDPLLFSPQADGQHLSIWHDVQRTSFEISRFSRADADAYPLFIEKMQKTAEILNQLNQTALPDMPETGIRDIPGILKFVKPIRSLGWKNITHMMRILPLSVSDLLGEYFESDIVKAAIAASALNNISLGPRESGTAFAFLQNFSTGSSGLFCSSGQYSGGTGTLTKALADAAKSFGTKFFTNAKVVKIKIEKGCARGVELAEGRTMVAETIVSCLDMQTTFLKLIDSAHLDAVVLRDVKNITYKGTTARVHFDLDALPEFTGMAESRESVLRGRIQIAPTLIDLQKAFDPVKYGQYSKNPYLDIRIPTLNDPDIAPQGRHLMSVTVKYMPYHLRQDNWENLRDFLGLLVIKTIDGYAPGFKNIVSQTCVITPQDLETRYNLIEGSLTQGDTTLDQSLWMRPIPGFTKYNSPVKALYLCGAATHPGAGVTGINGSNAARRILKKRD